MPVKQFSPVRSAVYPTLVGDLHKEWIDKNSKNAEPIVLEERARNGKLVHVYVIWEKWSSVDRADRSEIIMDAAEKALSPEDMTSITIAMGLTVGEARQMGLNF